MVIGILAMAASHCGSSPSVTVRSMVAFAGPLVAIAVCLVCVLAQVHRHRISRAKALASGIERKRIARVLHDTYLQSVEALMLRLDFSVKRMSVDSDERRDLERALNIASKVVEDGRDQVCGLRTDALEIDLALALAQRIETLRTASNIDASVHSTGRPVDLAPTVCREVYSIACEAIANAFRHAQARHIVVSINWRDDALMLTVADDGTGIAPTAEHELTGGKWGMVGMRERAESIRGSLSIRNRAAGGTELCLILPTPAVLARTVLQ